MSKNSGLLLDGAELTKAREIALLKKKELKEITEKKKIIKTIKKEENK